MQKELFQKTFANNLALARKKIGYTQKEVSNLLNISTSTLANYEVGKRYPNPETIKKIIDLYDISADWLFNTNPNRK